jgi:hypothetical protein
MRQCQNDVWSKGAGGSRLQWRVRDGEGENISLALLLPEDKATVAWAAQVAIGRRL